MCPWPRFQAAMLDEQSYTVTYQAWRGEPRAHGKRAPGAGGDCVDCGACVTACPTGIDIRDGIQLECINCGLCIDACNHVMERTGRPGWLITWDTLADQAAKATGIHVPFRVFRPRTIIYLSALGLAAAVMIVALILRPGLGLSVQHDRAPLFVMLASGDIRDGYTVKIVNKSPTQAIFEISTQGMHGATLTETNEELGPAETLGLPVPGDSVGTFRIMVTGQPAALVEGSQPIDFSLRDTTTGELTVYHSVFMGPVRRR
jgi:cytochrome c oxidase accessory protein FixG